jgi:hypothetical protein
VDPGFRRDDNLSVFCIDQMDKRAGDIATP